MSLKKRKNWRVLEGHKGSMDKLVENIVADIKAKDIPEKKKIGRWKKHRRNIMATAIGAGIILAIALVIHFQTYSSVRVSETYIFAGASDSSYEAFQEGVLKYSRDGVAFMNRYGEEQWNHPCQVKRPFVEKNAKTAAVADKGGNEILLFQKEGLIGEVSTPLPIEKISVSEQGIVCAILKNSTTPQIVCYDTAGNVLVEHKVSPAGMGYPMDVALSPNGEILQVAYLYLHDGKIISRVVYYDFGKNGKAAEDYQIAQKEYSDTILSTGFYMDEKTSAVIGDNCLTIFKGKNEVKEEITISFDKRIQSVAHDDKYIAVVLQNEGAGGNELRMYNADGKLVTDETFTGNYRKMKIVDDQIIMYDGKGCSIFMKSGIQKFDGEMGQSVLEIFPTSGVNKYVVMNAGGMEHVRLVK